MEIRNEEGVEILWLIFEGIWWWASAVGRFLAAARRRVRDDEGEGLRMCLGGMGFDLSNSYM